MNKKYYWIEDITIKLWTICYANEEELNKMQACSKCHGKLEKSSGDMITIWD